MKKLCAFFCMVVVVLSTISTSALAAEPKEKVIDLGDGFYVVETITQYPMGRSGDTVKGQTSDSVYYGSTLIGTATLYANFDISGSTAKPVYASITGSGYNGGTYLRGTSSSSGNTAFGTAYFKYNGVQKTLNISLSCTSDGTLY